MKRRLVVSFAVCVVSIAAFQTRAVPARAEFLYEDTCGRMVPSVVAEEVIHQVREDDVSGLVPVSGLVEPIGLGAGGTALSAATTIGVHAVAGVAGSLMVWEASCYVLDYVGVDSLVQGTVNGFVNVATNVFGSGDPTPDAELSGVDDWTEASGVGCNSISLPTTYTSRSCASDYPIYRARGPLSESTRRVYAVYDNASARTVGSITIPAVDVGASYATGFSTPYRCMGNGAQWACSNTGLYPVNTAATTYTWVRDWADVYYPGTNGCTTTSNSGVGGVCGVRPGSFYYVTDAGSAGEIHAMFRTRPAELARTYGWQRRHVVDVQCWEPGTTSNTWVRAQSPYYWDAIPSERAPIPQCDPGDIPSKLRFSAVPRGLTQTIGDTTVWTYETMDLPSDWVTTATAPDWITCLGQASDCGEPVTGVGDATCEWGGYELAGACGEVFDPETTPSVAPTTAPRRTGTMEPATVGTAEVVSTLQPETAPGGGGGGGTTVDIDIPIDEGGGAYVDGSDSNEAECWPSGWSWFNPAEWVLKPIKCGLQWAFVPTDMATTFDEFQTALLEQFPFSMVAVLIGFLDDLGGELETASGTGCFETGGSLSFGSFSVPIGDVCIGQNITITSGQRATVLALMLAPMVWGVLSYVRYRLLGGTTARQAT